MNPIEHLKIPAIPNYFAGHFGNLCYPEAGAAPRSLPRRTRLPLPPPTPEVAQCRALWPPIRAGEGQSRVLGALQPTDPTSFQFRGRFSESSPQPRHPLDEVRCPRGGARSWPAGPFTCCVQKRVVDIPFGAAAGFLVAGAGDLLGGGPRGHTPAALRWLLRVSVEQSWTRTRSRDLGQPATVWAPTSPPTRNPGTPPT